ncbi:MAG: aminopeptidase, partial [Candidatus Melainabacteria bacterium]
MDTEPGNFEKRPRARDLGIPFEGTPGALNAITDVAGVAVGYATLVSGNPEANGQPPAVRTGLTAILPRGKSAAGDPAFAGYFAFNGSGEMTGMHMLEETGFLEGPIMITNSNSVGLVRDAVVKWQIKNGTMFQHFSLPVVAETSDTYLSDPNGFYISDNDVFSALDKASSGPIAEGNVGGGTGMCSFEWKGGTGTSSRKLVLGGGYTVGVLVQSNFGFRSQATIAGVPVGKLIDEGPKVFSQGTLYNYGASIIVVIATDAPLLPHQLKRLAKRASVGVARTGGTANNYSGEIFIAFSTANSNTAKTRFEVMNLQMLSNYGMDRLIDATAYATEEAIVNALVASETMTGYEGRTVLAIPHKTLQEVLAAYLAL